MLKNNYFKWLIATIIGICILLLGIVIGRLSNNMWPSKNNDGKEVKSASFTVLLTTNNNSSTITSNDLIEYEEIYNKIVSIINKNIYDEISKEIDDVEPALISRVNDSNVIKITYICNNHVDSECLKISERYCDLLSEYIKINFDMNYYSFGIIDTPSLGKTVIVGD